MKRLFKLIGKLLITLISIPLLYALIALIFTTITVNKNENQSKETFIYLNTNGVHLDIILPKEKIDSSLLKDLEFTEKDNYFSFGWGDENFYLNTPQWKDLTFKNAINALFLKSSTLIHLTKYTNVNRDWVKVELSSQQLSAINNYIEKSFYKNAEAKKVILPNKGYAYNDDFYKAKGSYNCLFTCNTWVNSAFKDAKLKACLWTPFNFGLLNKYTD
ncbi:MAG: TIGR02117 family protein [Mesonia sp.]|uniref:TIGR02117 family protein n=1 Tax=Mesonia sp. TaxID=1960830 RepID=UPI0032426D18